MKQTIRSKSVFMIFVLLAAVLLASCAGGPPTMQRMYGAPAWQQKIEQNCAAKYGIRLEAEEMSMRNTKMAGAMGGTMLGGAVLVSAFQDNPLMGALIAGGGLVLAEKSVANKRAQQESAVSAYNECVDKETMLYHENQQKVSQTK